MDKYLYGSTRTVPCLKNGYHPVIYVNYPQKKSYEDCPVVHNQSHKRISTKIMESATHNNNNNNAIVPWTYVMRYDHHLVVVQLVVIGIDDKIVWLIDLKATIL